MLCRGSRNLKSVVSAVIPAVLMVPVSFLKIIFGFLFGFLITFYSIPSLIDLAFRIGLLDKPDGKLKQQLVATPYLGGVAIYLGFMSALAIVFPFENIFFLPLVSCTLLLLIGLIDDLISLQPHQKFVGQMIVTFCFLKAGLYLKEQFFYNSGNIVLSFFWILTIINAFNLVDVMDGLATILSLAAGGTFFVIALITGNFPLALLLACLMGALSAFLLYNKPPAKIYLGDAGSLFIGGWMAIIPFMVPWALYQPFGFLTPLIILMIPLLEIGNLILIRSYYRIPFYRGSPHHFSLLLQKRGWAKWHILLSILLASVVLFSVSLLFILDKIGFRAMLIFATLFVLFWQVLILTKP